MTTTPDHPWLDPLSTGLPDPLPTEPFGLLKQWYDRARAERVTRNPNAMTLCTIDSDGGPSARVVLCKGLDTDAGALVFFTNRKSRKGNALAVHPRAAAVFHWDAMELQARLEGTVELVAEAESDAYFASRPLDSRLGAWASAQSEPLASRAEFLERIADVMIRFDVSPDAILDPEIGNKITIPRPPHWGGYRLTCDRVELWMGCPGRLHDRALWTRSPASSTAWTVTRLFP